MRDAAWSALPGLTWPMMTQAAESHLDDNPGQMLPGPRRWLDGDDVMRLLTNALLLCNYNILTSDSDDEVLLRPEQLVQERHLDGDPIKNISRSWYQKYVWWIIVLLEVPLRPSDQYLIIEKVLQPILFWEPFFQVRGLKHQRIS